MLDLPESLGTDLQNLEDSITGALASSADLSALEAVRVATLGKSGSLTTLLKTLGKLTPDERALKGPLYNGLRERITQALATRKTALEVAALEARLETERVDISLMPALPPQGSVHPLSQVIDELIEIFAGLGFSVAEGPEIETDDYNFNKLNVPPAHPARAMQDTFYLTPPASANQSEKYVLRTQTSPVQVRAMEALRERGEPVRLIAPGRVYRSESDATHTPMFHQLEGLVMDRVGKVHMGHLKWTLETFLKAFFETDAVKLRLRPSFFPFTEPSVEVDIGCHRSREKFTIGEGSDWLEVLGAGMVHPNVIRNFGLDPAQWQGFAFGVGLDRLTMLKYGMGDLRPFFEGDPRWLAHHGFSFLDLPSGTAGLSGLGTPA